MCRCKFVIPLFVALVVALSIIGITIGGVLMGKSNVKTELFFTGLILVVVFGVILIVVLTTVICLLCDCCYIKNEIN